MREAIAENPSDVESPLVRASLREVLRLYPIATFVTRYLDSDAKVGDYVIPKGVMALASFYTTGRDPTNFTDPLKFSPDRWLRENNETNQQVLKIQATIPFSIGSRSCVGKKIAQYQIHCLITKILQQFKLESLNKEEVQFKSQMVGVPDQKILIAFKGLTA